MEEQALEPTLNLPREKAKVSRDAALQTSLLKSSDEAWTDAVDSRFAFETLRLFDYSLRAHGKAATASTKRRGSTHRARRSLTFYNDVIGSSGRDPKTPPDPSVDKDSLPFDLCTRLGKMRI